MKKTCAILALAAFALTGCSGGGQAAAVPSASVKIPASPTPTPSPTPCFMTKAEAGNKYLSIVCPTNAAIDKLNKAVQATPLDLQASTAAAAASRDSYRKQIEAFSDEKILWPPTVKADLAKMVEAMYPDLSAVANLASQKSDANFIAAWNAWPESTSSATAQKVRVKLGLSSDAMGSCKMK